MMLQPQNGLDADCLTKLRNVLLRHKGKLIQEVDALPMVVLLFLFTLLKR
jgi:hypothetical protein